MKYIVVTGGVVSGLGKGITISSIGRILKSSGLGVTSIKIDPYLNVDAGTMSPFEHGETFVLDDGGETDLDLGNYERFLDITLTGKHNLTTGKVYKDAIHKERRGDYLGKTVQIVPHVTDIVQNWIKSVAEIPVDASQIPPDVCLIEVGGTVGDIESMVFLEALRQFQFKVGRENFCLVHVSLVPVLGSVGEQKSKPTQHSVKELRGLGLSPDILVCRSAELMRTETKEKMSIFCQVDKEAVLSVHDVSNIYHVPLILMEQGMHTILKKKLNLASMSEEPDFANWRAMAHAVDTVTERVEIAIVGKYTGLSDAYLSVIKSLKHSGILLNIDVDIIWVEASDLEDGTKSSNTEKYESAWSKLQQVAGILVPGGFGVRGVEGKIAAAKFARETKKPFLGVCLGMQVMVIEYARNVLGKISANSTEFDETCPEPAIIFMPEINQEVMGGTMRLGSRPTSIVLDLPGDGDERSLASEIYGFAGVTAAKGAGGTSGEEREQTVAGRVSERHRHRYEVNPDLVEELEAKGLFFTGRDDSGMRMEIAELSRKTDHPFYLGTQYHPEFKSRPNRPSPPFYAFVSAACGRAHQLGAAGILWQDNEQRLAALRAEKETVKSPFSPRKRTLSDEPRSPRQLTQDVDVHKDIAGKCAPVIGWAADGSPKSRKL